MHHTIDSKIDPSKEEVYITHVFLEQVEPGVVQPLEFIARVDGMYVEGLDRNVIYTEKELADMIEEFTIAPIDREVRLMSVFERPILVEGPRDKAQPDMVNAEVYITDTRNVSCATFKQQPLLTYQVSKAKE